MNVNAPVNADRHLCGRVHGHVCVRTLLCIRACVCGRGQRGRVCKRTPTHPRMRLQVYTQHLQLMQTLPCVKLRRLVSHYVSLTADVADGKTGYRSSADARGRRR